MKLATWEQFLVADCNDETILIAMLMLVDDASMMKHSVLELLLFSHLSISYKQK